MQRDLLSASCVLHQSAGVCAASSSKLKQWDPEHIWIRPALDTPVPRVPHRAIS